MLVLLLVALYRSICAVFPKDSRRFSTRRPVPCSDAKQPETNDEQFQEGRYQCELSKADELSCGQFHNSDPNVS